MKIGIAIAVALAIAVLAFFGLRSVLSDSEDEALEAAADATVMVEGEGAELPEQLIEAGIDIEGEEAFDGGEWSLQMTPPSMVDVEDQAGTATAQADGMGTLRLPTTAGDAERELLLFGGQSEESLPFQVELRLAEDDEGWQTKGIAFEDPYPRPPEPDPVELGGLAGIAEDAASSALSLLGPGIYDQPGVYATPTEAPKAELLAARAANDRTYPPYLVQVPGRDLITGPVDRALVTALGCEYSTATVDLGEVEELPGGDAPGHLQLAEFRGRGELRPRDVDCRHGREPQARLPLDVGFAVQLARSRLSADSEWRVTRLTVLLAGEARDVYSAGPEVTADERDPLSFLAG